ERGGDFLIPIEARENNHGVWALASRPGHRHGTADAKWTSLVAGRLWRKSRATAMPSSASCTRQRLQHLLAVSPAIIYTTKASGDFACTYVSENLQAIMGYTPEEMTTDPKSWPNHLHPEDARRILDECPRLVERGKGTLEYRFRRREGGYI